MVENVHRGEWYRSAFGARDKTLVVIASTWGPESLLGQWPQLPEQLVAQLPVDEYQVVLVAHPGVRAAHWPWQLRAWLSRAIEGGLRVASSEDDWQAALVAASTVISDCGSLTIYAAVLGKPLLMAVTGTSTLVPDSTLAILANTAPTLRRDEDLRTQIDAAGINDDIQTVARSAVDSPEQCAARLRQLIYRLLRLDEPATEPMFAPISFPDSAPSPHPHPHPHLSSQPDSVTARTLVVGAQITPDGVMVERYPEAGSSAPHEHLHYRHIVADVRYARIGQLAAASILTTAYCGVRNRWIVDSDAELRRWPNAVMVASAVDDHTCLIRTRKSVGLGSEDRVVSLTADGMIIIDPLVLASVAYVRVTTAGHLPHEDLLMIGDRVTRVAVACG